MPDAPLVSVIIPCYNAERFIQETVHSVLSQTCQDFEVIILNDGSTDASEAKILALKDKRISYHNKENSGVSDTRNKGLILSKGDYVLFLDADDVLTPDFLETRLKVLSKDTTVGFCCGKVIKIDENSIVKQEGFRGTYNNVLKEILLYEPSIITCPSNYVIRKKVLFETGVRFNSRLSSTADRFFFIELSGKCKGGFVAQGGELLYRVSQSSMSHKISKSLIDDNELFYEMVSSIDIIPKSIYDEFKPMITYILGAAYIHLKEYNKGLSYMGQSFIAKPNYLAKKLSQKILSS